MDARIKHLSLTQLFNYIKGFCRVNLENYVFVSIMVVLDLLIDTRFGNPIHQQTFSSIPFGRGIKNDIDKFKNR